MNYNSYRKIESSKRNLELPRVWFSRPKSWQEKPPPHPLRTSYPQRWLPKPWWDSKGICRQTDWKSHTWKPNTTNIIGRRRMGSKSQSISDAWSSSSLARVHWDPNWPRLELDQSSIFGLLGNTCWWNVSISLWNFLSLVIEGVGVPMVDKNLPKMSQLNFHAISIFTLWLNYS